MDREDAGQTERRELSRLLFDATEIIEMHIDHVRLVAGRPSEYLARVLRGLREYRARQGWNPDGFGGEE